MADRKDKYLTIRIADAVRQAGVLAAERDGITITQALETFLMRYADVSQTDADPALPGAALHKLLGRKRRS